MKKYGIACEPQGTCHLQILRMYGNRKNTYTFLIMKYLKQFAIILIISFIGEVLNHLLPFPVPASIYGLLLLLTALSCGILRLDQVHAAGLFLISIMPVMFIPASVGLITSSYALRPIFLPVLIITAVSTIVVMAVAGISAQAVLKRGKKHRKQKTEIPEKIE